MGTKTLSLSLEILGVYITTYGSGLNLGFCNSANTLLNLCDVFWRQAPSFPKDLLKTILSCS